MAKERLPMRKTKEILRLCWSAGPTVRQTSRSVGVSTGVVDKAVNRARAAGLSWAQVEALDESELEVRLYGRGSAVGASRPQPDPVYMHKELRRPRVTLELLHLEYLAEHPDSLFDYIEVFYNQRRRHSTLGQISPAVFERRAAA